MNRELIEKLEKELDIAVYKVCKEFSKERLIRTSLIDKSFSKNGTVYIYQIELK